MMATLARLSPPRTGVAIRAAAILNPIAEDLDSLGHVLFDAATESAAAVRLLEPDLTSWTERCLERADTVRVHRVAGRSALPARTAAVVAVRCARAARLTAAELADCALLVAGNNLALDYQARTVVADVTGERRVRPSHVLTHMDTDVIGVVSELLSIHGEGWTVGAASASGAVAVIQAMRLLLGGEADRCLVVAPACELSATELRAFRDTGAMCPSGNHGGPAVACRPFDENSSGFVPGHGAAAVLLERADAASTPPLGALLGFGQRLDARRGSAPDLRGQTAAMRAALNRAGLDPANIGYVNAHATGSVAGDACEARALAEVFGTGAGPLVNSSKPLLGHTLGAAGLCELLATLVQLHRGLAHPNPATRQPIPGIGGRLVGDHHPEPLATAYALSNSFAFSGVNASLVVTAEPRENAHE